MWRNEQRGSLVEQIISVNFILLWFVGWWEVRGQKEAALATVTAKL